MLKKPEHTFLRPDLRRAGKHLLQKKGKFRAAVLRNGGAFAFSGKTDAERFMLESGRGKPLSKQNKSRRRPA